MNLNHKWLFIAPVIIMLTGLLTLSPPHSQPSAAQGDSSHWQGTITITSQRQTGTMTASRNEMTCNFDESIHIKVRLKEVNAFDVTDERGKLVGQRFELVDEGSTWTSTMGGSCDAKKDPCDCKAGFEDNCRNFILHSDWQGNGGGLINIEGSVYYSFTDESDFPNGMYSVSAASSHYEVSSGQQTIDAQRCYDQQTTELPLLPGPFFAIGGNPQAPITSELNDQQVRAIATGSDAGSYSYTVALGPQGDSMQVTVHWNLWKKQEVSCTLEQIDPTWLPQGDWQANTVNVTARLDEAQDLSEGKFRFTLFEVTQEPGYALNAGDGDELDLEFEAGQPGWDEATSTGDGWQIETTESLAEAAALVRAHDYGAWGKLRAEVNANGLAWLPCQTTDGDDYITIPLDKDGDRVADYWEEQHGVSGQNQNADKDAQPADQRSNGDGFSLYEEYRGFVDENRQHQRLDPTHKELFVRDEDGLAASSPFAEVSGLRLIYIGDDGWTGPCGWSDSVDPAKRVVNFNTSGFGHIVDQHALHVVLEAYNLLWPQADESADRSTFYLGSNYGSGLASPGTASRVAVFADEIMMSTWQTVQDEMDYSDELHWSRDEIEALVNQEIKVTTVHEMGHGVGLHHHVPSEYEGDTRCYMRYYGLVSMLYDGEWPTIFTRQPDCDPGESCWGQIQISDKLE
jgi:hypothetical protein